MDDFDIKRYYGVPIKNSNEFDPSTMKKMVALTFSCGCTAARIEDDTDWQVTWAPTCPSEVHRL